MVDDGDVEDRQPTKNNIVSVCSRVQLSLMTFSFVGESSAKTCGRHAA